MEKYFFSVYYAPETVLGVKRELNKTDQFLTFMSCGDRLSQVGHNMGYKAKQSKC